MFMSKCVSPFGSIGHQRDSGRSPPSALATPTYTLEAAAESVTIKPKPKKRNKTRKKVDVSSKPINAVGAATGPTIRLILDHMHLAMDSMLYQGQLVKNATVVYLQIDSSTLATIVCWVRWSLSCT